MGVVVHQISDCGIRGFVGGRQEDIWKVPAEEGWANWWTAFLPLWNFSMPFGQYWRNNHKDMGAALWLSHRSAVFFLFLDDLMWKWITEHHPLPPLLHSVVFTLTYTLPQLFALLFSRENLLKKSPHLKNNFKEPIHMIWFFSNKEKNTVVITSTRIGYSFQLNPLTALLEKDRLIGRERWVNVRRRSNLRKLRIQLLVLYACPTELRRHHYKCKNHPRVQRFNSLKKWSL